MLNTKKKQKIGIILLLILIVGGLSYYFLRPVDYIIETNKGDREVIQTRIRTEENFLNFLSEERKDLELDGNVRKTYDKENRKLYIEYPKQVTIGSIDGKETIETYKSTLEEVLDEIKVINIDKLKEQTDNKLEFKFYKDLEKEIDKNKLASNKEENIGTKKCSDKEKEVFNKYNLKDGDVIRIETIETIETIGYEDIKFKTKYKTNPEIEFDKEKVVTKGVKGEREIRNYKYLIDGKEIKDLEHTEKEIVKKPVTQVIEKGNKLVYKRDIDFKTEIRKDKNKYTDYSYINQKGEKGSKEITELYDINKKGKLVLKDTKEKTIKKPIKQIKTIGTKIRYNPNTVYYKGFSQGIVHAGAFGNGSNRNQVGVDNIYNKWLNIPLYNSSYTGGYPGQNKVKVYAAHANHQGNKLYSLRNGDIITATDNNGKPFKYKVTKVYFNYPYYKGMSMSTYFNLTSGDSLVFKTCEVGSGDRIVIAKRI